MASIGLVADLEIDGRFRVLSVLAQDPRLGAYGEVWRGLDTETGEFVAIKFYREETQAKKNWENETRALEKVSQYMEAQVDAGIETPDQICTLVACQVDFGQGELFGKVRYYVVLSLIRFFNELYDMASRTIPRLERYRPPPGMLPAKRVSIARQNEKTVQLVKLLVASRLVDSILTLHAAGVAHGDLHSGNVVITDSLENQVQISVEEWRLRFGDEAVECFNPLETSMDRFIRLRAVYGFREDDPNDENEELRWMLDNLAFDAKLLDLNLAIIDPGDGSLVTGSQRDPVYRPKQKISFEEAKQVDLWDVGRLLFQVAAGNEVWNLPYNEKWWVDLEMRPGSRFTKKSLINSLKLQKQGQVLDRLGRETTGTIRLPSPFSEVSAVFSIEPVDRMSLVDVQATINEKIQQMVA